MKKFDFEFKFKRRNDVFILNLSFVFEGLKNFSSPDLGHGEKG
jgi:hypothetical protein